MKNITVDKKLPMHEFLWRLALLYGEPAPGMASLPLSSLNPEPESAPALSPAMVISPYFKEKN